MTSIDVANDSFTCRQDGDLVVITLLKGAKKILTTINSKEDLMTVLETIKDSRKIKGVAILYSDMYLGNTEYRQFLIDNFVKKQHHDKSLYTVTYKNAIIQFLEIMKKYPIPIVGGMIGDIGPDSLGLNLALDLRIATDETNFFHPNLQLGLPPSALLSFYLVRSFGSHRATELMFTKSEFSSQEALDLGLITQITSVEELERTCLDRLRQLSTIPAQTLIESRRILQPGTDEVYKYIDAAFEGALRSVHRIKA